MSIKTADQKTIRKANSNAIKGFPRGKLLKCLDTLAESKAAVEAAGNGVVSASLAIAKHAMAFAAAGIEQCNDAGTVVSSWTDNVSTLAMQMAVKGHKFAQLTEGKDDKPPTAKLVGSGNNVMSTAKGCVEFGLDLDAVPAKDSETGVTYRDVQKHVQALRLERKRLANPDQAAFTDAIALCDDTYAELRTLIVATGMVDNVDNLTLTLSEILADAKAQQEEQQKLQAKADAVEAEAKADAQAKADAIADAAADAEAEAIAAEG
jgi:hypothetical protein